MRRSFIIIISALISFALFLIVERALGADNRTTVENKNTPVPSAISPSVQSYSQVICSFPVNAGMQTSVIGISGGTTFTDWECVRRMTSKMLFSAGLKVASINLLCIGSKEVWIAMLVSSTPCSAWNGSESLVGKDAIKYYKEKGYIDDKGNILSVPSYVGVHNIPNINSTSDRESRANSKYPK